MSAETPYPLLAGKRVALVGSPQESCALLRQSLEEHDAFCRLVDATSILQSPEGLRVFDAASVWIGSAPRLWDAAYWNDWAQPVVFAGEAGEIAQRLELFAKPHRQFVLTPLNLEEVILRLAAALAGAPAESAAKTGKPAVVLADDDVSITALLKATLTRQGIACHIAADGNAALALARENHP